MKEYLRRSFWRPGEYEKLILEITRMEGEKLVLDKNKLKSETEGKKLSEHGIAYDLHGLYKTVGGRNKTELMRSIFEK